MRTEPRCSWSRIRRRVSVSHAAPAIVIYAVFLGMLAVLTAVSPTFPSVAAVNQLLLSALPLLFAAMAQTAVVLIKGIDLSVGPTMSLVMVVAASLMRDSTLSILAVTALCLLLGVAVGAVNGALVVGARLQPIIVTLATSSVLGGVALYVMPQPGGYVPPRLGELVGGTLGPVPASALGLGAVLLLVWLPLRRSWIGQGWYAVGGNEGGAYYSGVSVGKVRFLAFAAAGLFAALGGYALAAQTLTGDPMIGAPYTLNSVAAVVLGGVSLAGGQGGPLGAIGGGLVLTILVDILFFFEVSAYYQYVISGAIVILALGAASLADVLRVRSARRVAGGPPLSSPGGELHD